MLPGGGLSVAVALVALVLLSAKAHGRQVRIERERLGVTTVDFRKDNGPVVETIWRHDRIRFWASAVTMAALLVVGVMLGKALSAWPLYGAIAIALTLAFATGFIAAGLTAWMGQARPLASDPAWMGRAHWGSFGWWTLVAAALTLVWFAV